MKKLIVIGVAIAGLVFGGVALAAAYGGSFYEGGPIPLPIFAKGGIFIGGSTTASTLNRVTKTVGCTIDYDFAAMTIAPGYAQTTPSYTCTGVKLGDPCSVGVAKATPNDGGSAWENQTNFFAIAKADDAIVIKLVGDMGDGGAMNPPDAGYNVRCFSNQ